MTRRIAVPANKVPAVGGRALFAFDDKCLLLVHLADGLYAIDDSCPHQGASLSGGKLQGRTIQCAAHGLRFDLTTGCLLNAPGIKVASYPVEVQGDQVFIVIASEDSAP
ncbi:2,4-dinitrotoluene dioxygenase system, ferredoxin component [compost metagenome]